MAFSVNTNAGALVALQTLNKTNAALNTTQSRISTGLKVGSAKDNAAVYSIAQSQRSEISGLNAVKGSLSRATGAIDTALAGAEAVSDLLIELKEKAVAAADTGIDASQRTLLNNEFTELRNQIDTIVSNAEFNGINALRGSDAITAIVNQDASSSITIAAQDIDVGTLGLSGKSITTSASAAGVVALVDTALDTVNASLAVLGAGAKRIESVSTFVNKLSDSIETGIGNLVDADLARESANLQSLQVKQQLGLQALSIANQAPGAVLSLFG
ncbi:flagellin [Emcibacter sp.]|uniref:flagellin n=1 Tax=Emcibacter sp. TaxID=1979954 RepID=UPI002AA6CA06|nr:flagellin [Emcibacter sp.]